MVAYAQAEEDVEPETRNGDFYGAMYDQIHCIADLNETGEVLRSYTYGPGIDNALAMTTYDLSETNSYYYLTDHLGSVLAITDEGGAIVERYHYDGWGRTTVSDANGMPMDESALGNRIAFQGREIAWATGLYQFRARWYDPISGRWLGKDPIGIAGGLNQYVAFANNPVMYRDPFGLETEQSGYSPGSIEPISVYDRYVTYPLQRLLMRGDQFFGALYDSGPGRVHDWLNDRIPFYNEDAVNACAALILGRGKGRGAGPKATSRAARRQAMRDAGIPTSRPAVSQSGKAGRRQLEFEGADGRPRFVTQHPADSIHPNPHWHAGTPKVDPVTGVPRLNRYGQVRYQSGGSTVEYNQ